MFIKSFPLLTSTNVSLTTLLIQGLYQMLLSGCLWLSWDINWARRTLWRHTIPTHNYEQYRKGAKTGPSFLGIQTLMFSVRADDGGHVLTHETDLKTTGQRLESQQHTADCDPMSSTWRRSRDAQPPHRQGTAKAFLLQVAAWMKGMISSDWHSFTGKDLIVSKTNTHEFIHKAIWIETERQKTYAAHC